MKFALMTLELPIKPKKPNKKNVYLTKRQDEIIKFNS